MANYIYTVRKLHYDNYGIDEVEELANFYHKNNAIEYCNKHNYSLDNNYGYPKFDIIKIKMNDTYQKLRLPLTNKGSLLSPAACF